MASRCTIPTFDLIPIPPLPIPGFPIPSLDFSFSFNLYCPLD